ncbi:HlyD family secretion protein [Planctomycetes bacterium K23_9]|uniref:HlyD family efflux transporter periplasmic adaptor subunit n=1 Tax=Stieleria marina TaxID=1930275 RepID=UPI0011AA7F89
MATAGVAIGAGAGTGAGAGRSTVATQDSLVHDTRREITEIIREVAVAARSDRTIGQFSSLLVDHILRAMAAEGVVIWYRNSEPPDVPFAPIQRCGRITDKTILPECAATHQTMLSQVAREAIPVVVPATPGASESTVPANPTDTPAAVVPIESDTGSGKIEYLIEVFLEPEGGVTTQRGYLRFVVQMADLAGEFLRAAELRRLKRTTLISQRVDTAIEGLHRNTRREQVQAAIVDTAADLFDFDRVALCIVDAPHATLAAVSHVNKIDHRSDGARFLLSAAGMELDDGIGVIAQENDDHSNTFVVAPHDSASTLRLVAVSSQASSFENRDQLRRFVDHASVSLRNASQFDAIPGGRLLASMAPALQSGQIQWWLRPIFTACVLTMLIILAMLPTPMYVHAPATVRPDPQHVQQVSAHRDSIVLTRYVGHGDKVQKGDILIALKDENLEDEIRGLTRDQSVLSEKQKNVESELRKVRSQGKDGTTLQNEYSELGVNLTGIDDLISLRKQHRESLVVRADRSGRVDSWRIEERLAEGLPLKRGDQLMRIVADDKPWIVDVTVPQNRTSSIHQSSESETLRVQVALDSSPDQPLSATMNQPMGPSVIQTDSGLRTSSVRLQLSSPMAGSLSGVPAKAIFYCGNRPAAYLLFQDVIAKARELAGLYFGHD